MKTKKEEVIKMLKEKRFDDLYEDLYSESILFDTTYDKIIDFTRYGWSEEHLAQCLCEDFPNRYEF